MDQKTTSADESHQEKGLLIGRRSLLAAGAGLTLTLPTLAAGRAPAAPNLAAGRASKPHGRARAKNVIFLASDGMSFGTWTLADMMRGFQGGGPGHWTSLIQRDGVRRGLCKTFSADSLVTDSAAAGSAWGIGVHINNSALNVTPEGQMPVPILPHAAQNGKATGLATTTHVCHATPASFVVNTPSREMFDQIAKQLLERKVDVILGGGRKYFPDELLSAHPDVNLVTTRDQLLGAKKGGRLLGLFNKSHLSYVPDRAADEPTLSEMSRVALERLSTSADGFVLQIEGGRVDHAAHANDAFSLIRDQLEFDDAVGIAVAFAQKRDDTLVIVTSDHGNANPGLTIGGRSGFLGMDRLSKAKQSFDWIEEKVKEGADLIQTVIQATGLDLKDHEMALLRKGIMDREPVNPFSPANQFGPVLGAVLANQYGVSFMSPNHTSDYVEFTAFGPGAELVKPFMDNIDAHAIMVQALGLASAKPV